MQHEQVLATPGTAVCKQPQAHLYVTRRGHVSATCRLSPEEELLVLDKATRVCAEAMEAAAKENAEGSAAQSSIGAQAGRCYLVVWMCLALPHVLTSVM